jgi:hypothetical protein
MNKHALVVAYNRAYLPALCGLLNALDYYGHKELDFHLLYAADLDGAISKILKADFNFRVIPVEAEPLFNPKQGIYMNLMFIKYSYAQKLRSYSSICHLDGDVLLLDNIMPYLRIASETSLIPCAEFPHSGIDSEYYNVKSADWVQCLFPLANFPVFYNPEKHLDMMSFCWEHMPAPDNDDRERDNEMYVFNKAVYECGKLPFILHLPGNPWLGDKYLGHEPLVLSFNSGKLQIRDFIGDRVHIIHNKYWKDGHAEAERQRVGGNWNALNNIEVIKQGMDFFNNEWKLKLKELE